jgi:AAA15 family ATPase/GTPase
MIESFKIENYRLFRDLEIKSLKRVNLIIGKNNSGKSTFLEAVRLYCAKSLSKYVLKTLSDIMYERGEIARDIELNYNNYWNRIKYLFTDLNHAKKISLYSGESQGLGMKIGLSSELQENTISIDGTSDDFFGEVDYHFQKLSRKSIEETSFTMPAFYSYITYKGDISQKIQNLAIEWGKSIALRSKKEKYVLECLQMIDSRISGFTFRDNDIGQKQAIVAIEGVDEPLPINNLGDGITHALIIIINFLKQESQTVLIDEFENGIHWSAQKDIWKIIFKLSKEMNQQVFCTTHSRDTLEAMQQASSEMDMENEARIIKLKYSQKEQDIQAVELDIEKVKSVLEQDLEIR